MIARIWHGWTSRHNADSYQRLLEEEIIPAIAARGIAGVDGPVVLRRDTDDDDEVEFITIMTFADTAGVAEFGGPGGASVVPPAARALLRRFDEHSQHYEVAVGQLAV